MTDPDVIERYVASNASAPRNLKMSPEQSALLYNLLCDNARTWNAPLRLQLGQVVTGTEAHNAKVAMKEGKV